MNATERRAVSGLAAIFALRLLGLFLILPVFALYAPTLEGYTPALAGVALGIYGLTQGVLQLVYGAASDRFGRKPLIALGLAVFAIGSVVAGLSTSIGGVIVGRALQGAGAIAAVVMAFVADQTREEQRTKSMALIGITVGASFVLSLLLGPVLGASIGVSGIFWLTAVLAVMGLLVLVFWVPPAARVLPAPSTISGLRQLRILLRNPHLLRLDFGVFFLHAVLTALFVVVPIAIVRNAGLAIGEHWKLYVPVMVVSAALLPVVIIGERRGRLREVFIGAVSLLLLSQVILFGNHGSLAALAVALLVFFTGFNMLEAQLPSLMSRAAPTDVKGMAIGIFTTFEFMGAFAGGAAGGWLHGRYGMSAVFLFSAGLLALWLVLAFGMSVPPRQQTDT